VEYHANGVGSSDVIKTFFNTKTKTLISRPRPSLVFKTNTKTLHLKTKTETFLWCMRPKAFVIFGRKRKYRRKWNSIYGRKRNENENGHSFSVEKRKWKSHDNISVFLFFSYIQSRSQPYNKCAANTSSSFAFLQVGLNCWRDVQCISFTVYRYLWGIF